jgi:signal transduction histidine kinase
MHRLHDDVRTLRDSEFKASLVLGRLRDALGDVRARELSLGVLKTDTVHRQLRVAIHKAHDLADSLARSSQDSAARTIAASLDVMGPAADREYEAWRAAKDEEADSISQNVMEAAMRDAERALSPAEHLLRLRTQHRVDRAETSLVDAENVSIVALFVALMLVLVTALWLTRSISGPVQALERGMRAVADGELDHPLALSTKRRDEFGKLAVSFRVMSQQLAELDQLKAEFVSVASHELKTPINVILGYLQLMQEGIYGPLSAKQMEVLGTIEAQGRTLARLAAHLLDVTRFEAGGGRIDPRPVKLATVLDDLERAFHVLAVQRGIDFRLTMEPGLPEEVQWDTDRINEVIGNLLANAFKFTRAGGTVQLVAAPSDGDHVLIEVRDTGAGIPPSQLPHIFEKFYQADNQRSASSTGTGLGLSIAKEIVEAHRGSIRCDSTLGKGTTFTLRLPIIVGTRRRTGSHRIVQLETVS